MHFDNFRMDHNQGPKRLVIEKNSEISQKSKFAETDSNSLKRQSSKFSTTLNLKTQKQKFVKI